MRFSTLLLAAALLGSGRLAAQNLRSTKAKTKLTTITPAKTKVKVVTKQPAAAKKVDTRPVIVFKRTPCFGRCPNYEATIYADGRVSYIGYRDVPLTGAHEFRLPAATIKAILADARRLNFATYDERYSQGTLDLPATVLSIRQDNGQLKTVQAEEGTPPELDALLKYIGAEIEKVSGSASTADR